MSQSLDIDRDSIQRPPPPPDDDDGPDDDGPRDCVLGTQLSSFTASPSTLPPSGATATLRWDVNVPDDGCPVSIRLNGRPVSQIGSQQVQPTHSTGYTLTAHSRRFSKTLGSVTVRVDTGACLTVAVPESLIREALRGAVDAIDKAAGKFRQRALPRVEVDTGGIHVALRWVLAVDNFTDPNVDIDFTIGLWVRNGAVEPFYRHFSVDVDWPWWVTVVSAGATKIVEEFVDKRVERDVKPRMLAEVTNRLDGFVSQLPGNLRLHAIAMAQDEIRVTACPV